ncbi:MAG: hypothetical protein IKU84_02725 [Clostridia bacterium]|nr:hypothetical protein [Clostridia bacterium]
MKKTLALVLMVVMSITLFAGCGDPVYDDLTNFINVEMAEVNANYEKLTAEVGTWSDLADDAALAASIKNTLLPLVDDSLAKLEAITPATEEVTALKTKYVEVMTTYKSGFGKILTGCETADAAIATTGYEELSTAVDILNEYNTSLEEMAKEFGAEVEY